MVYLVVLATVQVLCWVATLVMWAWVVRHRPPPPERIVIRWSTDDEGRGGGPVPTAPPQPPGPRRG